ICPGNNAQIASTTMITNPTTAVLLRIKRLIMSFAIPLLDMEKLPRSSVLFPTFFFSSLILCTLFLRSRLYCFFRFCLYILRTDSGIHVRIQNINDQIAERHYHRNEQNTALNQGSILYIDRTDDQIS